MQSSRKSIIRVILLWLILMVLLFFHVYFGRKNITALLYDGYMLVTPFSLTKFIEKRSIIERFGFQRNNALGLLVVTYLGLLVVYYFDIDDITGIFFAPLFEEILFRGYMLGTLYKWNHDEWRWISLTSFLFASGHIFRYYPTFPLDELVWAMFISFIGGLFLGFFYVWSRTILWCFLFHMLYNLFPPYRLPMLIVSLLIILLAPRLKPFFQNKRETDVSSKILLVLEEKSINP